jgi:flagellar assembly protein FliH
MIFPFEVEGSLFETNGRQAPPRDGAVSDLLSRVLLDVGGLSFESLDEPGPPVEAEMPMDEPLREAERLRADAERAAEDLRARVQSARAEALAEARRGFEMELEMKLVEERKRLDRMRIEFARDRQRFFAAAESQVVQLALAVARKILHRDALAEGLPLRATVKAALARVQDGSSTTLRVPQGELEAWTAMFRGGTAGRIEVAGDERMVQGECVLETSVGRVELGHEAQMDEVERGFGELMQEQGY